MTTYQFPSSLVSPTGTVADDGTTGGGLNLGFLVNVLVAGLTATGLRWWAPPAAAGKTATPYLFSGTGTQVASGPAVTLVSGWNTLPFTSGAALTNGSDYIPTVLLPSGGEIYTATSSVWPKSTTQFSVAAGSSSRYNYSATPGLSATSGSSAAWFGVDIVASDGAGGSNAGVLSASLPRAQSSIAGTQTNPGMVASSLPRPASSIAGTQTNTAALNAALPRVAASMSGTLNNPGVLAGTLPLNTAAVPGNQTNPGSLPAVTPPLVASVAGVNVNPGSMAATLPRLAPSIADTPTNAGVFAVTLPPVTAGISGAPIIPGALTGVLAPLTASLAGAQTNTAVVNAVLPLLRAQVTDGFTRDITVTVAGPYRNPVTVTSHRGATIAVSVTRNPLTVSGATR